MSLEAKYNLWRGRRSFKANRPAFYEGLAQALADGQSLGQYLEKKRDRAIARRRPEAPLLARWVKRFQAEGEFYLAIREEIPPLDAQVIAAAETSGKLEYSLKFLAEASRDLQAAGKTMRQAVLGAVFPGLMAVGLLMGFAYLLAPILVQIYPPDKWPATGQALYAVALFVRSYGIFLVAAFFAAVVWFIRSLPTLTGDVRLRLDRMLPYKVYADYNGAVFLVILASLIKSGFSFGNALERMTETATPWLRSYIGRMIRQIAVEKNVLVGMDVGLIPEEIMDNLLDFAESSNPQEAIERIGMRSMATIQLKLMEFSETANALGKLAVGLTAAFIIIGTITTAMGAADYFQPSR